MKFNYMNGAQISAYIFIGGSYAEGADGLNGPNAGRPANAPALRTRDDLV